jgi:P-type E1-E2 ATPase
MAIVVGKSRAAKKGIIITNSQAIDNVRLITTIAFDKTGTLTVGRPEVIEYRHHSESSFSQEAVIAICHLAESSSTHLIGKAIHSFCQARSTSNCKAEIKGIRQVDGGIKCILNERHDLLIGSEKMFIANHISVPGNILQNCSGDSGRTVVYIAIDNQVLGSFIIGDQLRSDTKAIVKKFVEDGKRVCIISGDNWQATKTIAEITGITDHYSQMSPFEKAEIVATRQELGEGVCFVGDGINDSPAMGIATTSIAIGTATDLTANSADIVLLKPTMTNVRDALKTCDMIRHKIVINFVCAVSYNLLAIPLASGIFLKYGIYISPTYSGVFMASSSLLVLFNSLVF